MSHIVSKTVIGGTLLGTALAMGAAVSGPANAIELKVATFMSPKHPVNKGIIPLFAKRIAKETGGSLTIKLFAGGQLGKGPQAQYKRVLEGVADITFGIQGYTATIFPRTMVVAQPGVGKTSPAVTAKAWKVYDQYLKSEYTKVKLLALFANWPPVLISRSKPIRSLADIQGLKVRAPSPANIPQIKAWGATAVYMPVSKIYNSLQTGVLDAVYISPGALYVPWRLAEPGKYVTAGLNGPTTMFFIAMNNQSWDGLSKAHKAAVVKHSGRAWSLESARYWGAIDEGQLKTARTKQKGVKFIQLSKAAAAAFDKATAKSVEAFLAAKEKQGIPARAIYKAVTE